MKKLLLLVLALAMALSLTACGGKTKEETGAVFKPALDTGTSCSITVAGSYDNFEALEAEFDKFNEIYPNVQIVWSSDSLSYGPEGCLSVPDRRGEVLRSQEIVIEYADMNELKKSMNSGSLKNGLTPPRRDTVRGFTAVIFQHEIDHLDGVLYIDRL